MNNIQIKIDLIDINSKEEFAFFLFKELHRVIDTLRKNQLIFYNNECNNLIANVNMIKGLEDSSVILEDETFNYKFNSPDTYPLNKIMNSYSEFVEDHCMIIAIKFESCCNDNICYMKNIL